MKQEIEDIQIPDDKPMIETNIELERDENLDWVGKLIKQVKYGDLSKQVDALVVINEVINQHIEENKESLIWNTGFLIDTFSKVLYDVFDKQVE